MRTGSRLLTFAAVLMIALSSRAELQIFAAASLTDALKEIAQEYQKSTGETLQFNFAGSNVLARQIAEGAPADLFFSADEAKMDELEKTGLLLEKTRVSLLSNSLVVVVSAEDNTLKTPADLTRVERVALADPKGVPAGIYAKQYLEKVKLWEALEKKIIPTENVRAALSAVESGNVDAAIVYKTDAAVAKGTRIACEVPPEDGPKISYPVAVIKESQDPAAAQRLLAYLKSEPALAVFKKNGFLLQQ